MWRDDEVVAVRVAMAYVEGVKLFEHILAGLKVFNTRASPTLPCSAK